MDAQTKKIVEITRRFGCEADHQVSRERSSGVAVVVMGARKGRLRSFTVGPSGEVRP